MTPEEAKSAAFEAWKASCGNMSVGGEQFAKSAWQACSRHYEREIEEVAKELDSIGDGSTVIVSSGKETCLFAANLLRTRLLLGD